jgi:hypothetical protein
MTDAASFAKLAEWMDADTLLNLVHGICPATVACKNGGITTTLGPARKGSEVDKQVSFHLRFARQLAEEARNGTKKAVGKDKPVPKVEVKCGEITAIEGMRYQSYAGYNCSCGADHVLVDSTLDKREEVSCGACGAWKIFRVRHYCANGDEL